MSNRVIQMLVLVIMCAANSSESFAQRCKSSGKSTWTEAVYYVDADCTSEFPSPNRHLALKFAANGAMSIARKTIHLRGPNIEPPAMVSWSPNSDAFLVNDGEGSGMTSTFRFFRIRGNGVY